MDESKDASGGRAEEETEADKFGYLSTLELPPEMMRALRPSRSLDDDVGEPPPTASSVAFATLLPVQMPSIAPPPGSPEALESSLPKEQQALPQAVCPPKVQRTVSEAAPAVSSRSQGSLPPVAPEVGEAKHLTSVPSTTPACLVEARPDSVDESISSPTHRPGPCGPLVDGGACGGDAWSAFGATVRHLGGPPISALFSGVDRQQPGSTSHQHLGAGFDLTFMPRVPTERAAVESREANAMVEPCSNTDVFPGTTIPPNRDSWGSRSSVVNAVAQRSCADDELTDGDSGCAVHSEAIDGDNRTATGSEATPERRFAGDQPPASDASASGTPSLSSEELRRIKSLSPPRRWKRPQPFINLDREGGGQLVVLSAPSSAPSDAHRPLDPFGHLNEPSAPSCPRAAGRGSSHSDEAPSDWREPRDGQDAALRLPPCDEPLEADAPPRPFTPPVVPVGRLLAGRSGELLRAAGGAMRPTGVVLATSVTAGARLKAADGAGAVSAGRAEEPMEPDVGGGPMARGNYEPVLDICYDPKSNRYYERRHCAEAGIGSSRTEGS